MLRLPSFRYAHTWDSGRTARRAVFNEVLFLSQVLKISVCRDTRNPSNSKTKGAMSQTQHLLAEATPEHENKRETLLSEMCRFTPLLMIFWLLIGCIGLGSTFAVQPVFFQRAFAAHSAKVPYANITCPLKTKNRYCLEALTTAGTYSTYSSGISSFLTLIISPWVESPRRGGQGMF